MVRMRPWPCRTVLNAGCRKVLTACTLCLQWSPPGDHSQAQRLTGPRTEELAVAYVSHRMVQSSIAASVGKMTTLLASPKCTVVWAFLRGCYLEWRCRLLTWISTRKLLMCSNQIIPGRLHRNRVDVRHLRKDARGVSSELGIGRSRRAALLRAGGGSWGPLGAISAGFRWFPGSVRAPF